MDAGSPDSWSEGKATQTLDKLFDKEIIDVVQYLSRLPKGSIPDLGGLIRELQTPETEA